MISSLNIAVVIPCYRVKDKILSVLTGIGQEVDRIYVVDDCCPEHSGHYVQHNNPDKRVCVIVNKRNMGVGGAVIEGYKQALSDGMDIIVKLDGDGQMDPAKIPLLVSPIVAGQADYTKGNRFYNLEKLSEMPRARKFGNAVLSFMTKISSGYWNIFDPTNGFTAVHRGAAVLIPFDKLSLRYFFETDILFRLNIIKAVVVDVPMDAFYGDEKSNLKISKILFEFLYKHTVNFLKRIFYNYYLRDMSLASLELPFGVVLLTFGILFGSSQWYHSVKTGNVASSGTVMLSALPLIVGIQFILAFIGYDISTVPSRPLHIIYAERERLK